MNALTGDAAARRSSRSSSEVRRARPRDGQPVQQGPAGHRDPRRAPLPRRPAHPRRGAAPAARPGGRAADRGPAAHPHPQDPRRARRPTCRRGCCAPTASRCPACTPRARWPASAAAGCTATARWRGRSSAAASSRDARRAARWSPSCGPERKSLKTCADVPMQSHAEAPCHQRRDGPRAVQDVPDAGPQDRHARPHLSGGAPTSPAAARARPDPRRADRPPARLSLRVIPDARPGDPAFSARRRTATLAA